MLPVGVDIQQNLVMTVFRSSSIGVTVLLRSSTLLAGDSLPADLQHVHYLTMVMLRRTRTMLYIYSHQLTVLKRWWYNDCFVQPDLLLLKKKKTHTAWTLILLDGSGNWELWYESRHCFLCQHYRREIFHNMLMCKSHDSEAEPSHWSYAGGA